MTYSLQVPKWLKKNKAFIKSSYSSSPSFTSKWIQDNKLTSIPSEFNRKP